MKRGRYIPRANFVTSLTKRNFHEYVQVDRKLVSFFRRGFDFVPVSEECSRCTGIVTIRADTVHFKNRLKNSLIRVKIPKKFQSAIDENRKWRQDKLYKEMTSRCIDEGKNFKSIKIAILLFFSGHPASTFKFITGRTCYFEDYHAVQLWKSF